MKDIIHYLGLAGFISLLSLAAAWIAVIFLIQGEPFLAIYTAIVAFLLDSFDGYVARKRKTESEFGRQLDSMIDFLNYSIFSALLFILYITPNFLGILVALTILVTGVLRLVRFNVEGLIEETGEKYYSGVVVCFLSLATASLFLAKQFFPEIVFWVAPPFIFILSFLQISRVKIRKTHSYHIWFVLAISLLILTVLIDVWIK